MVSYIPTINLKELEMSLKQLEKSVEELEMSLAETLRMCDKLNALKSKEREILKEMNLSPKQMELLIQLMIE